MPTNPLIFNPSLEQAAQVIHDLGSPHLTLRDIAELHSTTIQSLTLWIALPDTSSRLSNINNAVVARSRHAACNYLARATETVITSLDAYIDEEKHIPVRPNSIEDREQRRRSRQTACHAVSLLLRIARFNPLPAAGRAGEGWANSARSTKRCRYTTAHSNRINEVLTSLGAPPSISADEVSDRVAADSPSASPAPLRDTSPSNPRQHTNGDHYNRITDLVTDLDTTPNPIPAEGRAGERWASNPTPTTNGSHPNTAATLQARAGAPQPFTPLTISAKHLSGKTNSCSTPCARGCTTPHPP